MLQFTGCFNNDNYINDESEVVELCYNSVMYGNYIYYNIAGIVFRYNVQTGVFSSACLDPTCDHTYASRCIMYDIGAILFFNNNCMYFMYPGKDNDNYYYGSYNLLDGTLNIIKECSPYETFGGSPKTDGTYIYYTYNKLKEKGDKNNPDDYIPAVFRQPLEGGKEKFLCYIESTDMLNFVVNDKLVFCSNNKILFCTDINGDNKRTIFNVDRYTFLKSFAYLDGYIYFLAYDGTYDITLDGIISPHFNLLRVNIMTGEYEKIVDNYVALFKLTDEKIYYLQYDLRYLYIPDNIGSDECTEVCTVYDFGADFWCCKTDGSNPVILLTNEYLQYDNYTVINNKIYGEFRIYNKETNEKCLPFFGNISMNNGEITIIADMKDYVTFAK